MTDLRTSPLFAPTAPTYDKETTADKTVIDRAVFNHVLSLSGGTLGFAKAELRLHNGQAPNSKQAEWDIVALRELHAKELATGGPAVRQRMAREGEGAPANAGGMLNSIVAFNGDECGCSLLPGKAFPADLTQVTGRGR